MDALVRVVDQEMLSMSRFAPNDEIVLTARSPPGTVGSTNLLRVHRLGTDDTV